MQPSRGEPPKKGVLKPRAPTDPSPNAPGARRRSTTVTSPLAGSQRKWNTPKDLQNILFEVRLSKTALQPPPLIGLAAAAGQRNGIAPCPVEKGAPEESVEKNIVSGAPAPQRATAKQSVANGTNNSGSRKGTSDSVMSKYRSLRQSCSRDSVNSTHEPSNRRSLRRTDTIALLSRVVTTLDDGHGIAIYTEGLQLLLPGEMETIPVVMRVSSNLLLFHERAVGGDAGDTRSLQNAIVKIPLTSIVTAQVDSLSTVIMLTVFEVLSAATSPRCSQAKACPSSMEVYEVAMDDSDQLEEILVCILHQQIKAFHSELGRVRKSLKASGARVLDIVHFNDVYHLGAFKKEEPCGGLTRFHEQLEMLRRRKNPLVLFSGDFVGPSLMSVITKGKQMVDALNFMGTHYGVFGNHEFDFGLRNLERIIHGYTHGEFIFAGSNTTWLMTNMTGKDGEALGGVSKRKLLEWNGIMVGIVGLCENWLPHCVRLNKGEAHYQDIFEVGEAEAQELKREGAEIVIALTHNRLAMDREVTKKCPSIDLLLGGHDHFYKKELDKRVIKSGEEFQWLSEVQVTLDETDQNPNPQITCKTHAISSELPESMMIKKLVERYGEKMREKMGKVIGRTQYPLDSTEEACRFKEGILTNFLADVMVTETGADAAILGGAAVAGKAVLEPGPVTIGDVFNWFPDEIKIQVVEMPGEYVHHMIEVSIRELPEEAPSFPHPSGELSFVINQLSTPPTINDLAIGGVPYVKDKLYKVAVTDFVASGKERFRFIRDHCKVLTESEHAEQFSLWILNFFHPKKSKKEEEVAKPQQTRRRRRSSYANNETGTNLSKLDNEGFGLKADDLDTLDVEAMRKLMIAMSRLAEETNSVKAQDYIKCAVKDLLGCDRATIFLVDHVSQTLRFMPDGQNTNISIPLKAGIVGVCATSGEVVEIPDAYEDSRFNQAIDKQTGYRTNNIIACPVKKNDGTVVAVMQAVNKLSGSFTESDIRLLNMFGKQTAVHINHAEMFESLQRNEEATQTLLKIAKEISSDISMDMNTMVACIMQGASQLMRCDRSSLFLVDSKNSEMWTVIVDPLTRHETVIRLPLGSGLAGRTAVTGQIINLKDAYESELFSPEYDRKNGYRTKSVLCVPIFTMEGSTDVLGVLQFINKLDGTEFSPQDEKLAFSFASFAGISIANTQEIDLLKLKSDEILPELPHIGTGRIRVKGGWATLRSLLKQSCARKDSGGKAFRLVVQKIAQQQRDAESPALVQNNTNNNFSAWVANVSAHDRKTSASVHDADMDWGSEAESYVSD